MMEGDIQKPTTQMYQKCKFTQGFHYKQRVSHSRTQHHLIRIKWYHKWRPKWFNI
jgi:hypothetical protein